MGKKIILHESQLKRLIQHQSKLKLNEGITFNDEEQMKNELNLDVEDGKFVDDSENETAWDGMYDSDGMEEDSISLNEGQLKLKESFKKFVTPSIINRQSSDIVRKRKR
jgi:hypothetical protein